MESSEFGRRVRDILSVDLPSGRRVFEEAHVMGKSLRIGRTAFFDEMGVSSEVEYKRRSMLEGLVMVHAHIGMSTWRDTADALRLLHTVAQEMGVRIDRFGLCLDRRMALPRKLRKKVPPETGPTLDSPEDWVEVGRIVPIQPHMGDFVIGFPASTENTVSALRAGITTIGNLSQYFSMHAPMWRDHVMTAVETVKASSIMGALRERGALLHSYLEDGFGALFYDCATVAGWAYLEKYIVEDLLGAKIAHCIGGLTSDPVKRAGWTFALDLIHEGDCVGSMMFGDTISFTDNLDENRGMIAEYFLWDIMAQIVRPTGHAVLPLPVTEAIRVPSAEEIIEAQVMGRRMEKAARRLAPHVDFSASLRFGERVVSEGRGVFTRSLEGLEEAGVDTKDPLQMLYVLKHLGPAVFEEVFGAGEIREGYPRDRVPVVPTDVFEHVRHLTEETARSLVNDEARESLGGRRFVLASTDVHEHALFLLHHVLQDAGAEVINLGPERNPDDMAEAASMCSPDGMVVSTHNGMALEFARRLKDEMSSRCTSLPVIMGGRLNQKREDCKMPIDVEEDISRLGFIPCKSPKDFFGYVRDLWG
jgi:methylmalonyl-CoA mutase cobalamin-binding subunit